MKRALHFVVCLLLLSANTALAMIAEGNEEQVDWERVRLEHFLGALIGILVIVRIIWIAIDTFRSAPPPTTSSQTVPNEEVLSR